MSSADKIEQKEEAPREVPQLGALEEDDEFEEFPQNDWDESETSLAKDGTTQPPETYWEENWDDDDIEDDFSKQLRDELAKAGSTTTDTAMTS